MPSFYSASDAWTAFEQQNLELTTTIWLHLIESSREKPLPLLPNLGYAFALIAQQFVTYAGQTLTGCQYSVRSRHNANASSIISGSAQVAAVTNR